MKKPLVFLFFVLLFFGACRHNPPVRHTVISKICFASNLGYNDSVPYVRVEIDSSLNYQFYGADGCIKHGYYEGKASRALWDTLTKYISVYIQNTKPQISTSDAIAEDSYPPKPISGHFLIEMLVHYDNSKVMYIEENYYLRHLLFNSYKTIELRPYPADGKYAFEIPIKNQDNDDSSKCYRLVDKMPVFPSGKINDWLANKLTYPKELQKKGITGTVYATFVVERDGSISNLMILKGVPDGQELDNEVLKV